MRIVISITFVCCLVIFAPSTESKSCRFWRTCLKPTLPSPSDNPQFYEKFQVVPPKNQTAKKLLTNFLRIRPGSRGKRSVILEDTVVLLDGSGSVPKCQFNIAKKALKNLIEITQPGYDAKHAAVTFSTIATVNFRFLPQLTAAGKMDAIPYPRGGTNTQAALQKAKELFESPNAGSRRFSRKMVFLLTDGKSNVEKEKTIPNAKILRNLGVEIFVVAVGNYIDGIEEMVQVASYPPQEFLFRVETMQEFYEIVTLAIKEVDPGKYTKLQGQYNPPC